MRPLTNILRCLLASTSLCAPAIANESRPNILFLFADDQSHETIGALGHNLVQTPHLDRLAREGLAFTRAAIMGGSSPAVCSPSRASLMTGRTLWNIECQGLYGFEISEKFPTLPQVFRENGYITFATGKNEPGRQGAFARSFTTGDKILFRGMTASQFRLPLFDFSPTGEYPRGAEVVHTGRHSAEVYAEACIRFLREQAASDQPFFAYVSFQTPHDPWEFPEDFAGIYREEDMPLPESFLPQHPFDNGMLEIRDEKLAPRPRTPEATRRIIARHYATVTHTDAQIGRILEALDLSGKRANTLIVYAADNGIALGRHGLIGKQNVYDHSVRVPLIISGPGIPRGETRGQLCYLYDIHPTLLERAGLDIPETVQFKSLNPLIADPAAAHRGHLYHAFMSWQRAIRDERFKLIEYRVNGASHTQLFDIANDPEESNNLAADPAHAATLLRLRALLREERVRLNDGNTPYRFSNQQGLDFWNAFEAGGGN